MRIPLAFLALPLLALPLLALSAAQAQSTAAKPAHTRLTMEQRFEKANVTHDGHLTEAQAKAGYPTIVRHFAAIDQDKKGYVTEDDIRAYNKLQRTLRHQSTTSQHGAPNS